MKQILADSDGVETWIVTGRDNLNGGILNDMVSDETRRHEQDEQLIRAGVIGWGNRQLSIAQRVMKQIHDTHEHYDMGVIEATQIVSVY